MSRHAHLDDFLRLADSFSRRELLDLLGVDRRTLGRWRSGRARIPWTAYQLMYERSHFGLAERDAAEGFQRTMLLGLVDALTAKVARLEAELLSVGRLVDWACANDPFARSGDVRTALRGTSPRADTR